MAGPEKAICHLGLKGQYRSSLKAIIFPLQSDGTSYFIICTETICYRLVLMIGVDILLKRRLAGRERDETSHHLWNVRLAT